MPHVQGVTALARTAQLIAPSCHIESLASIADSQTSSLNPIEHRQYPISYWNGRDLDSPVYAAEQHGWCVAEKLHGIGLKVQLHGENLLDNRFKTSFIDLGTYATAAFNRPRSFGVRLNADF